MTKQKFRQTNRRSRRNKRGYGFVGACVFLGWCAVYAISCASSTANQLGLVSLDVYLTGNLATLGLKPQLQSLYNAQTQIPSYITSLNVSTETNQQPDVNGSANAELWTARDPRVMYGYAYNKPKDPTYFGIHQFIVADTIKAYGAEISTLKTHTDQSATAYAKPWLFATELQNLKTQMQSVFSQNNAVQMTDPQTVVEKLKQKTNTFKQRWQTADKQNLSLSLWGSSYGPNWVQDITNYAEYSPATIYPDWLYSDENSSAPSLGFVPAVPTDSSAMKLAVQNAGGFNALGWYATTSSGYSVSAVHTAFEKSSDYVVVAVPTTDLSTTEKSKIQQQFKSILKEDKQTSFTKNIIFVNASNFALNELDLLGVNASIDALDVGWMNVQNTPKEATPAVQTIPLFETNSLTLVTRDVLTR